MKLKNNLNLLSLDREVSSAKFINLNFIRALSGFVVIFSHFFQIFVMPVSGRTITTNFFIGLSEYAVLTFFVLSGFLIALSINRNIEEYGYFEWREYVISRVARIYPALIASVLLCYFLSGILILLNISGAGSLNYASDIYPATRSEFYISIVEVVSTLAQTYAFGPGGYMTINGPLWSLGYEVGFYLLAGLIITSMFGRGFFCKILSTICIVLVVVISVLYGKWLFYGYGTIWVFGVMLYIWTSRKEPFSNTYSLMTLLIGGAILFLSYIKLDGRFIHDVLSSIIVTIVLLQIMKLKHPISFAISTYANSTYSLYLFHFPLMIFIYALLREYYDQSHQLYFISTFLLTLSIIPCCHFLSKLLENRKFWVLFVENMIFKLQAQIKG
jgi:peptidoglycan/LPS O-acetylase OafA/YrhL